MMKSLYEELGGTYTLGNDGMLYPNFVIGDKDLRPIGKWGRMHMRYLEAEHPGLYEWLFLNGTLFRHLANANERAESMLQAVMMPMFSRLGGGKTTSYMRCVMEDGGNLTLFRENRLHL